MAIALRLPAGQTEKRDGSGRERGKFGVFRQAATRSTIGQNAASRGDFGQEKGPGESPSPGGWWWGGSGHQTLSISALGMRRTDEKCRGIRTPIVVILTAPDCRYQTLAR